MSAPLKPSTPAPLTGKCDWVRATTDKLKSGLDNELEVYNMKVGERKRRWQAKKEEKEKEVRERQQKEEAERRAREEAACLEREEAACLEREAAVRWEAAIKKAMETVEKRAQEDMEEKHAEVLKKIWVAEEMVRQRAEAEASRQKSVVTKKRAREENVVARPSGMLGPGLR